MVARYIDPDTVPVSTVMTSGPHCVGMEDSAMEALGIMVDRHFRHLPVVDGSGVVTGVLNIAKCLYDALSRLERAAAKSSSGGPKLDAGMASALLQMSEASSGRGREATAMILQQLLVGMTGEGEADPSLESILDSQNPAMCVSPGDSVRSAGEAMAEGGKAVVVVECGVLVGIFTPKDILNRVIGKGLNPGDTPVSEVMTSNPDSVSPDTTVIEALHQVLTIARCMRWCLFDAVPVWQSHVSDTPALFVRQSSSPS
ncbi:unnamed protein product [Choristocarpus tenellus]